MRVTERKISAGWETMRHKSLTMPTSSLLPAWSRGLQHAPDVYNEQTRMIYFYAVLVVALSPPQHPQDTAGK